MGGAGPARRRLSPDPPVRHDHATLVYNHITPRLPGTDDQFLIHEFGLGYNEITASNLVKIDVDGHVLEGTPRINPPGYVIHSAVHAARHDVNCVMHTHTPYGMAVSALESGFVPLQWPAPADWSTANVS